MGSILDISNLADLVSVFGGTILMAFFAIVFLIYNIIIGVNDLTQSIVVVIILMIVMVFCDFSKCMG